MRYRGIDDFLERFLSLDLFVENSKCHILKVNNVCIFPIKFDLFFDYAEHKLFLILLFIRSKIDTTLNGVFCLGGVGAFEELLLYLLFPML